MAPIKTLSDLQVIKKRAYEKISTRILGNQPNIAQIRVAMATVGIAAGAKEIFDYIIEQADARQINVVVTQTGIIGEGNQEPVTVELALPDQEPRIFANVDKKQADKILDLLKS